MADSGEERIGLIGLGLVGNAVVRRLVAAGYSVHGYDIADAACDAAVEAGAVVAAHPADPCRECSLILLSLPDADAVDAALWGDRGVAAECRPGTTVLDTTTTTADATLAHHARLEERDVQFVDVTLVGSSQVIADGDAIACVGAPDGADFDPVLRSFNKAVYYFGALGLGNKAKLIVNLFFGLHRLVLAEGLALALKADMDAHQLLELLRQSAAYSVAMDQKGDKMLDGDFEPVARLAQHAKDVRLILELAQEAGARAPLSELHAQLLQEAEALGAGAQDNAAIIRPFLENR